MSFHRLIALLAIVAANGCDNPGDGKPMNKQIHRGSEIRIETRGDEVGRINWDDPEFNLEYRESSSLLERIETVSVDANGKHLYCKRFESSADEKDDKPSMALYHDCNDEEWKCVMRILKSCGIEVWHRCYRNAVAWVDSLWYVKICSGTNLVVGIIGSAACPESFDKFLQLKEMAFGHPEVRKLK